jgi:hypothetical protein
MQLKLTRFQTLTCIRSDAILHATVAKSGHTNTTKQQKFKHMLKSLSMLQNLTKLSTSKQNLQLLFSLRNYIGAKDKDIIELKWTKKTSMVQRVKLNFVRICGSIHILSNSELHASHYKFYSGILVQILGPKTGFNEQY